MPNGKQWIHMDAQFPLGFGHEIQGRFGAAGELLFILFLCGCKRSFPQGHVGYRSEEELRIQLGAFFEFEDNTGGKWTLDEFWRWLGRRKVVHSKTVGTRRNVYATRWNTWEDTHNAKERERKRRSRARSVTGRPALRGEVESEREVEVGGGSVEGGDGAVPASPQGARPAPNNGRVARPDPTPLTDMVAALEAQAAERDEP